MNAPVAGRDVIGFPLPRVDGRLKVSGQATYAADVQPEGCLWAAVLRSPYPHARLTAIDTTKARRLPGVHAVLAAADIGSVVFGRAIADVPVLASDRVRFVGEPVAAVAAEDRAVAEQALDLIDVTYEELPAVFDPFDAMRPDAPILHPGFAAYRRDEVRGHGNELPPPPDVPNLCSYQVQESGDIENGFAQADLVLEHTYRTPLQHQGYIEPHACVVSVEAGGMVRVWASSKSPFGLQRLLARDLGIPADSIAVEPCYVGGDFGGKGSPMHVPLAYFLSRATGRPVKLVLSGVEEVTAGNPRHASWTTIRTGLTKDGLIVARHVKMVFASGAYAGFKPMANAELACGHYFHGVYRIPNSRFESLIVYTNHVPCGHMRGPGGLQSIFAAEVDMDRLAEAVGLDPIDFRVKNGVQPGDPGILDVHWSSIRLRECLDSVRRRSGWDRPKPPGVGRGIALCQSPIGAGVSTVRLEMDRSGDVALFTSVFDQGSGSHTILTQIAARELGISPARVRVVTAGTGERLYDRGSSASAVTHGAGKAALQAAASLKQQLASGQPPLSAIGRHEDWSEPDVTSFVAQAVELAIDQETGQATNVRVTGAYDVGTILNPTGVTGQIEGGLLMGLGAAAMEDLRLADGRVETPGFHEYKLPTMADLPEHDGELITDDPGPGPYGAKQTSELSNLALAAAYANAVYDATGVRLTDLPITAEKVYDGLKRR